MSPPALRVRDLTAAYGPVPALRGITLEVPAGGVAAVLGGNGAGKSTLLRALSGVLPFHGGAVTGGEITAGGTSLRGLRPDRIVAAGVVHVPEGRHVFARMTVAENLRAGSLGARDRRRAAEARDRVHALFPILAERSRQPAGLLSGGEQQMLAIGRALMAGPDLLLLDEPSLGLAPLVTARIAGTITEINRYGTAVLLIEQNAALALRLADHAYVLETGAVALHGTADELAASDEVRRRYLGVATSGEDEEDLGPGPAVRPLARWAG
ncbi:ABC transporter ATP-binding protein [Bailinhaonella thermotolerans]|uniref:ABC transporter ATP-binding protein n=1 Tax=Bailinhaonella thermotolerans TaxID=1070861 RepID=A0A3A4BAS4_9ACTN|nr:ABC transporter ATP-binding protein [Bailinhaonella thermotolerans]RJL36029.1 ABC transporter ATP-binding protein [Bailinhaonella thermotolerans]